MHTPQQHVKPKKSPPAQGETRRGFFPQVAALVFGAIAFLFPFLTGLVVFFDPLRRKAGGAREIRITSLGALPADGIPRQFQVIADLEDAWNRFPNEPIGGVYLIRQPGSDEVQAFNATCPHAGCFVDYRPELRCFRCPCHTSTFDLQGKKISKVPPRDMDGLLCEVRKPAPKPGQPAPASDAPAGQTDEREVWIMFQNFYAGKPVKKAKV